MKTSLRFFLVFLCALTYSNLAQAEGYLRLGASYISTGTEAESGSSTSSRLILNFGGGYISQKGWTVGGTYVSESADSDPQAYGITGGWITRKEMGFYVLGSYFVEAGTSTYPNGWGYQADLGYKITLRKFAISPQISYKKLTYKTEETNSRVSISHVDPMLVFWFEF